MIPAAASTTQPAKELFKNLTLAYFEGDVEAGQMVGATDIKNAGEGKKPSAHYDTTLEDLATLRNRRGNIAGFEPLHPRYLQGVSDRLYSAIDADRMRRRSGVLDLEYLSLINFCLQLGHLAKDGTGRTGEDMLVWLAAEAGRTLTFSQTGYRGALEGPGYPLVYRLAAEKILFSEFIGNFFKYLGLPVPQPIPLVITDVLEVLNRIGSLGSNHRQGWPDGLGPAISRIYQTVALPPGEDGELFQANQPYRSYAEFLACEMIYFTLCLEQPIAYLPALKARYPVSLACCQYGLEQALERSYHPIPDDIGSLSDEAVALIEAVRMGWSDRGNSGLEEAVTRVEAADKVVGRLVRAEYKACLTEAERAAFQFDIPHGMTGAELDGQIGSMASKVLGEI